MDVWVGVLIAGVVGFGLGLLVMWWADRKRSGGSSVATLKKEHEQFREQVTDHFVETAERINRLTDSYKDLFDHLSHGAETLVDESSLRERMPRVSDQEVRLKRLGTRTATAEDRGPAAPNDDSKKRSSKAATPSEDTRPSTRPSSSTSGDSTKRATAAPERNPAAAPSTAGMTPPPGSSGASSSAPKPSAPDSSKTDKTSEPEQKEVRQAAKAAGDPEPARASEKKPSTSGSTASQTPSKP